MVVLQNCPLNQFLVDIKSLIQQGCRTHNDDKILIEKHVKEDEVENPALLYFEIAL
jgi:hypothetical protein